LCCLICDLVVGSLYSVHCAYQAKIPGTTQLCAVTLNKDPLDSEFKYSLFEPALYFFKKKKHGVECLYLAKMLSSFLVSYSYGHQDQSSADILCH
jgi:hypothetical protein